VAKQPFTETVAPASPWRPSWKLLVVIGVVLVTIIGAGIVGIFTLVKGETAGPKDTVLTFDRAFRTADCGLYESVTSPEVRDALEGTYSCSEWSAYAKTFWVNGKSQYKVELLDAVVKGTSADVKTLESDISQSPDKFAFLYRLTLTNGEWIVTDVVQGPAVS
jgi:hypothetical protein